MKYWPVPKSYNKNIPMKNKSGSFWENRNDRYHCGIDIYAQRLSKVKSIDDGIVINFGIFTSPEIIDYWNTTYFVDILSKDTLCLRYAELDNLNIIKKGERILAGDTVGYVGQVLNKSKINTDSPLYIQKLKERDFLSMLHFEMYKNKPIQHNNYLGGNWFGKNKPNNLLDPTDFLISIY